MLPTKRRDWARAEPWIMVHDEPVVGFWDGDGCRGHWVETELRNRPCKKCVLCKPPYKGDVWERERHTVWYHADGSVDEETTIQCWCDDLVTAGCTPFPRIPYSLPKATEFVPRSAR